MNIKKLLAVILAAVMLLGVLPLVYADAGESATPEDGDISVDIGDVEQIPEESEGILGDIDGDGSIDALDLGVLQAYLAGKTAAIDAEVADIDCNGSIDALDLGVLQAHLAGKTSIG